MKTGDPYHDRLTLRPAEEGDCLLLHGWRNHPSVRSRSFQEAEIPLEEHEAWFRHSLERTDRLMLVALLGDIPVGVIRYDISGEKGEEAEVNIHLAPERQGRGLGKRLLEEGEQWIAANTRVRCLRARVKEDNEASIRMFRNNGYGVNCIEYVKGVGRELS